MSFTGSAARLPGSDATAFRILARSLVRELNRRGYAIHHIVTFANELIDLACDPQPAVAQPSDDQLSDAQLNEAPAKAA